MKFFIFLILFSSISNAQNDGTYEYFTHEKKSPNDYLFGSFGKKQGSIFDDYREVKLDVDIGISQDCGRLNFGKTLRASVKNILSTKHIKDVGRDILGASPLLLMAYLSPTWSAIMSQARLRGNFHAGLRLNQCALINKYVSQRNEDFMEERSKCIQREIKRSDGDMESAVDKCKNYRSADINSWTGRGKSKVNKLLESSFKWAGLKGKSAKRSLELAKAFVGDSIIREGKISVDFGPRRVQMTPKTYMNNVHQITYKNICKNMLTKITNSGGHYANINKVITENDLNKVNKHSDFPLLDHQTLQSLAFLPTIKRESACRKLAEALSLTIFTEDMQDTLDLLSTAPISNPNLNRKKIQDANLKRRVLKDQIEMTLALHQNRSEPLAKVLSHINSEGEKYQNLTAKKVLDANNASVHETRVGSLLLDCADPSFCNE